MGSLHVHSLGIQGWLALGFDGAIADGPGADFIVSENAFYVVLPAAFAEVAFVEVSSNGADYARFPAFYWGPQSSGGTSIALVGSYSGLAGQTPVYAGSGALVDPQDVCEAGGDAFDLADLRDHPLVRAGRLDLQAISSVRLVDVRDGDLDARGVAIRDPQLGSADVDAVTVIHQAGSLTPHHPEVRVDIPPDGNFSVSVRDPDGLADLDLGSLRLALWGLPVSPIDVLSVMQLAVDANGFTARLGAPLPPGFVLQLAASVRDRAGHRSGAVRQRPLP
jgi:hypothetical protein